MQKRKKHKASVPIPLSVEDLWNTDQWKSWEKPGDTEATEYLNVEGNSNDCTCNLVEPNLLVNAVSF